MAAPASTTIKNLAGSWSLERASSDDIDPILALQGVSWFTRTAAKVASMTITITHTTEADGTPVIDISQHITGGIKGSSEHRILDNKPHPHKDNIFGNVDSSNGLLNAKDGKPDFTPTVSVGDAKKDGFIASFLRGEIGADGKPCEGYLTADGNDVFMHNLARSTDSTWVAEQIWGFETVAGERRYVRRTVVVKGKNYLVARLVYVRV